MPGLIRRAAKSGALPNVIVIGARQCGTSALHYYMGLHPEIQMSNPKEINFFVSEDGFEPGQYSATLHGAKRGSWSRGIDWYATHFSPEAPVRGESSTAYSELWHPRVAERMASLVPDARLILIVREPVERCVSDWMGRRVLRGERRSLEDALTAPGNTYLGRTRYWSKLRPFLEHFPLDRLHLVRQDDLLRRRRQTLSEVFGFLGVDESFWDPRMERLRNLTATKTTARYRLATGIGQNRILSRNRALGPLYRLGAEPRRRIEEALRTRRRIKSPAVSVELRRRILIELEPEIAGLEEFTGWELADWRP